MWWLSLLACTPTPAPSAELPVAVVAPGSCEAGAADRCLVLRTRCAREPSRRLRLRVSEAAAPVGTVLLASGGGGQKYFGSDQLVDELVEVGWTVVDRAWDEPWQAGDQGLRGASCGAAALLRWMSASQRGPIWAIGSSAGAGELAAVLGWYQPELLAGVVLASGPPYARLDLGCDGRAAVPPPTGSSCDRLDGGYDLDSVEEIDGAWEGTPCADGGATLAGAGLAVAPIELPHTEIKLRLGSEDCSVAVSQALRYRAALVWPASLELVAGASHRLQDSAEGRAALRDALGP